jgi:serine/threonine-protein kinase
MVSDVFGIVGTNLSGVFQVESVVAEGGFGVVYRAEHVAFRAPVALKCLKIPGMMSPEQREQFVEGFREEGELLFHLSAQIPEVVRAIHADTITLPEGTLMPYIALEWIEGKPLDSIIILREDAGEAPLSLRQVIKMLTPIAHALHRAHRFEVPGGAVLSITHCDLKPENILITESSRVPAKILDFGIAKARELVNNNVGSVTDSDGARPFTPSYGAPEQWVPKRFGTTGRWTDVWGLALTMVECLTGRPPLDGDIPAMMGTALDTARRPTPRTEGADIPPATDEVFARALAVDPRQRYQSVDAFWTDLERAFGVASSFARAAKRRQRSTYDDGPGLDLPPSEPPRDSQGLLDYGGASELDLEMESGTPSNFELAVEARPSESSGRFDLDHHLSSDPGQPISSADPAAPPGRPATPATASGAHSAVTTGPRPAVAAAARSAVATGSGPAVNESSPTAVRAVVAASRATVRAAAEEAKRSTLILPIVILVLGLGLVGADMIMAQSTKSALALGPIKVRWVGALLSALGIVLTLAGLAGKDDDA